VPDQGALICWRRARCRAFTRSGHGLTSIASYNTPSWEGMSMPRKLRELRADLRRAAFRNRGGKGDHQNWEHPQVAQTVGLAGKDGDDALPYQERAVREALEELGRTQKGVQP